MRSVSTSQSWTSALPHAPTVRRKQAGVHPNFPCNAQSAGKATETTKRSKVKRVLIHVELWKSLILINPTIIVQVDSNVIGKSQNAVEGTSLIIAGSVRKGLKLSKSQKKLQFFEMILEPLERPLSFGQRPQLPSAFILSTSSIFTEILAFISAYSDASHDSNFSKFHIIYSQYEHTHSWSVSTWLSDHLWLTEEMVHCFRSLSIIWHDIYCLSLGNKFDEKKHAWAHDTCLGPRRLCPWAKRIYRFHTNKVCFDYGTLELETRLRVNKASKSWCR